MISAKNLTKFYGDKIALDNLLIDIALDKKAQCIDPFQKHEARSGQGHRIGKKAKAYFLEADRSKQSKFRGGKSTPPTGFGYLGLNEHVNPADDNLRSHVLENKSSEK